MLIPVLNLLLPLFIILGMLSFLASLVYYIVSKKTNSDEHRKQSKAFLIIGSCFTIIVFISIIVVRSTRYTANTDSEKENISLTKITEERKTGLTSYYKSLPQLPPYEITLVSFYI